MKSANSKPGFATRMQMNRHKSDEEAPKQPVRVFCRLRPMLQPNDVSCIRIISETSLVVTPLESATNIRAANKAIQTSFSHVFGSNATQKEIFDIVALPLTENLLNGKNGLLFTYGVTGSGKTYTMSGNAYDAGILPRCLDVLFNSITNYQTKKFVFKPDRLNGFDAQSESDAMLDRESELQQLISQGGKTSAIFKLDDTNGSLLNDELQTLKVEEDNAYAVFITYIEVYNTGVYDLLEEVEGKLKPLQSKVIREDANRNMYIHGCTEVEVKSSVEAFELFQCGQFRRHIAYTNLNAESSRSHSIFTIRLVQAPLDKDGEHIVLDKRAICISQLSLVDLAGSERTNRSKNTGERLREAGKINNSLMTLRTCLEILRENQTQGTKKIVPYRDSKLTHLFKNFFDGEGTVRMIVCVNPSVEDYSETIQVLKFAEVSQEVQVTNSTTSKLDLGYTPGRRQANKMFKEARNRLEYDGHPDAADLEVDLGLVYSLGGPFPETEVTNPHNDEVITALMRFLEMRIHKRSILQNDLKQKQNNFRNMLVRMERENVSLRIETSTLRTTNNQQQKKINDLEAHICKKEGQIDTLLYRLNSANNIIGQLKQELKEKDMLINQRVIEKQRVKNKYKSRIQEETNKMSKELDSKLRRQREILEKQMKEKSDKLKLVKKILSDDESSAKERLEPEETEFVFPQCDPSKNKIKEKGDKQESTKQILSCDKTRMDEKSKSEETIVPTTSETTIPSINLEVPCHSTPKPTPKSASNIKLEKNYVSSSRKEGIPVANLRYRRSQSAERWIDHRPTGLVPVGTILQPFIRNKRSVTQLTDPKDITNKVSRYCLVAQDQDTDGELETKLYKGDIIPTSGGGAQVVFNDMEHLKQISPIARRKRSGYLSPEKIRASTETSKENNTKKPRI